MVEEVWGGSFYTKGHSGAFAGEDEDEGGDELGERGLERFRVDRLSRRPHGDAGDRHCQ